MELSLLLVRHLMMVRVIMQAIYVFIIIMEVLGYKKVLILMEKLLLINLEIVFLFLQMEI